MKHSVLVITYNSAETIEKTLDSLINQTVLPSEILVCDDSSTDNTSNKVCKYVAQYPDLIKLHVNAVNLGIGGNIISGVQKLQFRVVSIIAGDDWVSEDAIEVLNQTIEEQCINLDVDLFACVPGIIKVLPCGTQIKGEQKQNNETFITKLLDKKISFLKMGISRDLVLQSTYPAEIGPWADFSWDMSIAIKVQKVIIIDKALYFYNEGIGVSSKSSYSTLATSLYKSINNAHLNYSKYLTLDERNLLEIELLIAKLQVRNYKYCDIGILLRYLQYFGLKKTIRQIVRIIKAAIAGWIRFE